MKGIGCNSLRPFERVTGPCETHNPYSYGLADEHAGLAGYLVYPGMPGCRPPCTWYTGYLVCPGIGYPSIGRQLGMPPPPPPLPPQTISHRFVCLAAGGGAAEAAHAPQHHSVGRRPHDQRAAARGVGCALPPFYVYKGLSSLPFDCTRECLSLPLAVTRDCPPSLSIVQGSAPPSLWCLHLQRVKSIEPVSLPAILRDACLHCVLRAGHGTRHAARGARHPPAVDSLAAAIRVVCEPRRQPVRSANSNPSGSR